MLCDVTHTNSHSPLQKSNASDSELLTMAELVNAVLAVDAQGINAVIMVTF